MIDVKNATGILAILLSLVGAGFETAQAQDQASPQPVVIEKLETDADLAQNTQGDEADQKIRCVRQVQTGTRFRKKVCMTLADWKRAEEAAKLEATGMKDQGAVNSHRPSGG